MSALAIPLAPSMVFACVGKRVSFASFSYCLTLSDPHSRGISKFPDSISRRRALNSFFDLSGERMLVERYACGINSNIDQVFHAR